MRLHIVPDEKVINRSIELFEEVFPDENTFIVLVCKGLRSPKYVKKDFGNVLFLEYDTKLFWNAVGDINRYQSIIIHFLSGDSVNFLNRIKHHNIYWIAWGADLYSGLLEERGYKLYESVDILWRISKWKIPYFIYKLVYKIRRKINTDKMLTGAKKVHYFVPDSMYDEYPLLLSYYPELAHLEYRDFFYYPIDDILGEDLINTTSIGRSVIIGNSSSPTGNHLSVISYLRNFSLGDKDIIVPLSYGNKSYAALVEQEGMYAFGKNFKVVKNFLLLDDYNQLLLSANIFIYGNWRQEAVGNILIALYLGGKVFLDKRNPLLNFYKSLGLTLFDIEELSDEHLNSKLSSETINDNRKILKQFYSKERLISLIRENF